MIHADPERVLREFSWCHRSLQDVRSHGPGCRQVLGDIHRHTLMAAAAGFFRQDKSEYLSPEFGDEILLQVQQVLVMAHAFYSFY